MPWKVLKTQKSLMQKHFVYCKSAFECSKTTEKGVIFCGKTEIDEVGVK